MTAGAGSISAATVQPRWTRERRGRRDWRAQGQTFHQPGRPRREKQLLLAGRGQRGDRAEALRPLGLGRLQEPLAVSVDDFVPSGGEEQSPQIQTPPASK